MKVGRLLWRCLSVNTKRKKKGISDKNNRINEMRKGNHTVYQVEKKFQM